MGRVRRCWIEPQSARSAGASLKDSLGLHPVVADILWARESQADAARRFLDPSLAELANPRSQKDMDRAEERLLQAIEAKEAITVYGDYDVDGQCGTALLVDFLRAVDAQVDSYTPDRMQEGYGLSEPGVRAVAERGCRLLVTVDCGIASFDEVALANELGMEVIICDHHQIDEVLPSAVAVLNPHREDCGFAERLPCATGVAFNLICALRMGLRERGWFDGQRPEPNLKAYLDLVALATIADVVPLRGHNRILVHHGLQVIGKGGRPGMRALCAVSNVSGRVSSSDLGFRLGPRLNACGRLGDASRGVELLLTREPAAAHGLARELDDENHRRRGVEAEIVKEAVAEVESGAHAGRPALVLGREGWHPGVLGIVAARLVDRYHRPVAVVGFDQGEGKGSARSVKGFDFGGALRACSEHLVAGGGHAMAAGLTVEQERFDAFRDALCMLAEEATPAGGFVPSLRLDAEVGLEEIDGRLIDDLARLEPFGAGNPEPILAARGVYVTDVRILKNAHLKCRVVSQDGNSSKEAIGFGMAELAPEAGASVDVAFTAGWNDYRGRRSLQLLLKDIRPLEQEPT